MGTDIHAIFQKQSGSDWVDIPCDDWEQQRHYFLFAWLANVRNGFGFAGVKTGEPIIPIAEQRGLPPRFQCTDSFHTTDKENMYPGYREWADDNEFYMGDHSHSWLLGSEILAAKLPRTRKTGVISLNEYHKWDKISQPDGYSGSISGPNIFVADAAEVDSKTAPEATHVQVEWWEDGSSVQYFVDIIKKLVKEHGEIRMVFGFDS